MTAQGVQFLKQKRIHHQVVKYAHEEMGAESAAMPVNFSLAKPLKRWSSPSN